MNSIKLVQYVAPLHASLFLSLSSLIIIYGRPLYSAYLFSKLWHGGALRNIIWSIVGIYDLSFQFWSSRNNPR